MNERNRISIVIGASNVILSLNSEQYSVKVVTYIYKIVVASVCLQWPNNREIWNCWTALSLRTKTHPQYCYTFGNGGQTGKRIILCRHSSSQLYNFNNFSL